VAAKAKAIAPESEATIIVTRTLDAPRELVWEVWTNPAHAGKWWGPNGYTTTTTSFDLRVGGAWLFTMHGPDGKDWPNKIVYSEIVKPERLVYQHGDDVDADQFRTIVTFTEDGDKTHVRMMATFPSIAARNKVAAEVGAVEGGAQHLDNMADYVGTLTARSS
jgi:uncharacterized protein YndB with AHSA1/START domain